MTILLNASARSAAVTIDQRLDAAGVEALIEELSVARAAMQPEVSLLAPQPCEPDARHAASQRLVFQIHGEPDGKCRLCLRDAGVGWRAIDFPIPAVISMYEILRQTASGQVMPISIYSHFDSALHPRLAEERD